MKKFNGIPLIMVAEKPGSSEPMSHVGGIPVFINHYHVKRSSFFVLSVRFSNGYNVYD